MEIKFVLGELTCQSIPVLITVATVSRCPDGFAPGCAISGFGRRGGEPAWRSSLY